MEQATGVFDLPREQQVRDAISELNEALYEHHHVLGLFSVDTKSLWRMEVRNNTIGPLQYFTAFGAWRFDE